MYWPKYTQDRTLKLRGSYTNSSKKVLQACISQRDDFADINQVLITAQSPPPANRHSELKCVLGRLRSKLLVSSSLSGQAESFSFAEQLKLNGGKLEALSPHINKSRSFAHKAIGSTQVIRKHMLRNSENFIASRIDFKEELKRKSPKQQEPLETTRSYSKPMFEAERINLNLSVSFNNMHSSLTFNPPSKFIPVKVKRNKNLSLLEDHIPNTVQVCFLKEKNIRQRSPTSIVKRVVMQLPTDLNATNEFLDNCSRQLLLKAPARHIFVKDNQTFVPVKDVGTIVRNKIPEVYISVLPKLSSIKEMSSLKNNNSSREESNAIEIKRLVLQENIRGRIGIEKRELSPLTSNKCNQLNSLRNIRMIKTRV